MRNLIDSLNAATSRPATPNFLLECQSASSEREITEFFIAYGKSRVALKEGRLNEAGFWKGVGKAVGLGFKGVKTASDALSRLKVLAQSTGPVQAFDQKADQLIATLSRAAPESVVALASKYADWAKANPVKQGLIIGVLTAAASLATGPAGGAGAGYVLRFASELLKGEKASGALAKGVLGAGLGWLAGVSVQQLAPLFHVEVTAMANYTHFYQLKSTAEVNGRMIWVDVSVPAQFVKQTETFFKVAAEYLKEGDYNKAQEIVDRFNDQLNNGDLKEHIEQAKSLNAELKAYALKHNEQTGKILNDISAFLQGMANTSMADASAGSETPTAPAATGASVAQPARSAPVYGGSYNDYFRHGPRF